MLLNCLLFHSLILCNVDSNFAYLLFARLHIGLFMFCLFVCVFVCVCVCLFVSTLLLASCCVHCVNLAIWLQYDNKLTYLLSTFKHK